MTVTVPVKAGTHTLWATTVLKSHAVRDDLIKPFLRTTVDGLDIMGDPSVDRLTIEGPRAATGSGDTASRRKIFVCHPRLRSARPSTSKATPRTWTKTRAPRGSCPRWHGSPTAVPWTSTTVDTLMGFYRRGRAGVTGGSAFDRGIESALQFILASPEFLVRFESDPPNLAPSTAYRLDDLALASRLSFFLWSSLPDDQLLTLASQGKLKEPAGARAAGQADAGRPAIPARSSPTSPSSGCTCEI